MRGSFRAETWHHDPALYAPARYRRSCSYEAFVPIPLAELPPIAPEVAGALSAAEDAIRRLNAVAHPALAPLARLLLRTESIASSKIEGMQVDARSLARAEARQEVGHSIGRDALQILANVDAMELAVEEAADEPLTVERLLGVHRALLGTTPTRLPIAGVVRMTQNWIGGNDYNPCGAAFVPPPPEEVGALLDDLVRFCNDDALPPLAQAALAHAQFETIHPFADGNGRTGRALVQIVLRRRGIAPAYVPPISVVLAADRARYIVGLVDFREGREDAWLESFSNAAERAAGLAAGYLDRVRELQEQWRERLGEIVKRSDAAAWLVLDELPGRPIVSTAIAGALVRRTRPAVNQAVAQLVDAGVLIPLDGGRRNRQWEAEGMLDLLADLDAALPPSS